MNDSVPVLGGSLVLGRYRVVRELARGGMGMVYLGRIEGAAGFAKPVVVKRVLSHMDESTGSRAQFIREARLLSELHHPNIVGVIDFGEEAGSYLMVLEYVHGFHVGHWLKYAILTRKALQWEYALYVVGRVLTALHYAHTRVAPDGRISPIIHRDVSPGNVLVDLDGNVRLLDFGIARSVGERDEAKTQEGIVKGKLPYIAPEMYQSKDASVASDVYAAGVMLYQLLSGKNPFSGKDMGVIVTKVLSFIPPPISTVRSDVPKALDGILSKALSKDPAARYESANAFATALAELQPRSESEILEQVRLTVGSDFTGTMPRLLNIASLSELDAAWRASSSNPDSEQPLQRSSSLPPFDEGATAVISAPRLESLTSNTRRDLTIHEQQTTLVKTAARGSHSTGDDHIQQARPITAGGFHTGPHQFGSGAHTISPSTNMRTIVLAMLGAGLLAGSIAAAVLIFGKPTPSGGGQRFLLVERQPNPPPPAGVSSAATAPAVAPSGPSTQAETPPSPTSSTPLSAPPRSTTAHLTSAFAKRQGAVQTCFKTDAGQVQGAPRISVRFQVTPKGAVQSATLSPAELTSTSLGQCLLSVARTTTFPAADKSLTFSIPITAQVVPK